MTIENVPVVWPAETVTVDGIVTAVLCVVRLTTAPPAGATALRVTVPVAGFPPVTLFGEIESDWSESVVT